MIDRVLRKKSIFVVCAVVLCCALLWNGGSVIATVSVAVGLLLFILLPGVYVCLSCNIKEHFLPVAFSVGLILFVLCYLALLLTGIGAVFYGVPPLIGAMGLFRLYGGEYRPEVHRHGLLLSFVGVLFALCVLPSVELPNFSSLPFAEGGLYSDVADAVLLLPSETFTAERLLTAEVYDLLVAGVGYLFGLPLYEVAAFYLPLLLLVFTAVSVYSLADRYLKNRHRALLSTLLFFFASPLVLPIFDGGFFATERLLFSGEFCFVLILMIASIIALSGTVGRIDGGMSKGLLSLLPPSLCYLPLCLIEPLYALFLLFAQFVITIVYTVTGRFYLRVYLMLMVLSSMFFVFCRDFLPSITLNEQFEMSGLFDGLLRNSYTASVLSYNILFPIASLLSILFILFPSLLPSISEGVKTLKNLKISGYLRLLFLLTLTAAMVGAFLIEGGYEILITLVLLIGAIVVFRAFARKKSMVAIAFIAVSTLFGVFNIGAVVYDGVLLQLQSFGYVEYEQERSSFHPTMLNALEFIHDNTENSSVLISNVEQGEDFITAMSGRVCLPIQDGVVDDILSFSVGREEFQELSVDYLLFEGEPTDTEGLALLYSEGDYFVYALS